MSTQWRDWCRWARAVSDAITTSSDYLGFWVPPPSSIPHCEYMTPDVSFPLRREEGAEHVPWWSWLLIALIPSILVGVVWPVFVTIRDRHSNVRPPGQIFRFPSPDRSEHHRTG
jgi:hypothetical protein